MSSVLLGLFLIGRRITYFATTMVFRISPAELSVCEEKRGLPDDYTNVLSESFYCLARSDQGGLYMQDRITAHERGWRSYTFLDL